MEVFHRRGAPSSHRKRRRDSSPRRDDEREAEWWRRAWETRRLRSNRTQSTTPPPDTRFPPTQTPMASSGRWEIDKHRRIRRGEVKRRCFVYAKERETPSAFIEWEGERCTQQRTRVHKTRFFYPLFKHRFFTLIPFFFFLKSKIKLSTFLGIRVERALRNM